MSFIVKNTSGLINTKLTDTGRLKLSQGTFQVKYFQIGDSEVSYNTLPTTYNLAKNMILLAGYVPDVDIKIKFIGQRPGEKLYEEIKKLATN